MNRMNKKCENLCRRLPKDGAALIAASHHLRYLTGFPSGDSWLLLTSETAYFLTDFRYIETAKATLGGLTCLQIVSLSESLKELFEKHGICRVYLEAAHTTLSALSRLQKNIPTVEWDATNTLDNWLCEQRAVKDENEVRCILQAQALCEQGFSHILPFIREGVTEREIALELEFYIRKQGAEQTAFDFVVVSGANTSLPHGIPTDKAVQKGDFITMDFGAVVGGYCSDMTRTVALGTITEEQHRVYQTVLQAQQSALSVLRAGVLCRDADAAARQVIEAAGYGENFGHATGHGIGVEIHEQPNLSPRATDTVLKAGNVVTVEPGIYLEHRFGVRIEDMALITKDGYQNLTSCTKELICL
jgi:Xaa-Pro aminopeptidase